MNKVILSITFLTCMINPISLYSHGGGSAAAAGIGAGLFGLGIGALIGSRNREPQVVYVQQEPQQNEDNQEEIELDGKETNEVAYE